MRIPGWLAEGYMPAFLTPLHEFNPCHTPAGSPAGGQFCSTGPGASLRIHQEVEGVLTAEDRIWAGRAREYATGIAHQFKFPAGRINVVWKPARRFTIDEREWTEGGHYSPTTGLIEVNLASILRDDTEAVARIVAHEIAHAKFEVWRAALNREANAIPLWSPLGAKTTRSGSAFRMDGAVYPQFRQEFRQMFPAHAAVEDTWGHGYTPTSAYEQMGKDDGFTAYSKAYWQRRHQPGTAHSYRNYFGQMMTAGPLTTAMNETLAEVAAFRVLRKNFGLTAPAPSPEWRRFSAKVNGFYDILSRKAARGEAAPGGT